jgi:hypothetical protein
MRDSIIISQLNQPESNLKLPDGGAKLKAKLEKIDQLLSQKNVITDKVPLSDKIDIRKESLLRSSNTEVQPSNLLRAHHQNPADTDMDKKHVGLHSSHAIMLY